MSEQQAPAGWHPDPERPGWLRWWDGQRWTDQRHVLPTPGYGVAPPKERPSLAQQKAARRKFVIAGAVVAVLFVGFVMVKHWTAPKYAVIAPASACGPSDGLGIQAVTVENRTGLEHTYHLVTDFLGANGATVGHASGVVHIPANDSRTLVLRSEISGPMSGCTKPDVTAVD